MSWVLYLNSCLEELIEREACSRSILTKVVNSSSFHLDASVLQMAFWPKPLSVPLFYVPSEVAVSDELYAKTAGHAGFHGSLLARLRVSLLCVFPSVLEHFVLPIV